MSQGFITNVASRLEANIVEEGEDEEDPPPSSYITHLYPSDCSNIMSTMKSLITGFVERPPAGQDGETTVVIPDISRVEGCCVAQ
jgi:origin recognition complex subunit 3